jgi:hypothetical protein
MPVTVDRSSSGGLSWTSLRRRALTAWDYVLMARDHVLVAWDRVLEGGLWSFGAYLIATGFVYTFVLISVNRHTGQHLELEMLPARTMSWLTNWHTYGFAKYAGLLVYSSDGLTVYKSHSGFHLWPLYAIELVIRVFIGRFSYRAAAVFNQSVIWVGAALLGWLGMRLTKHVPRHHAFFLGLGCAVVYQTFPMNLMNYWYLNPISFAINAMLVFWLAESYQRNGSNDRWISIATSGSVVLLALSYSQALTFFFLGCYVVADWMIEGSRMSVRRVLRYVVAPAAAVVLFQTLQIAWVQFNIANVNFTGNLNFADFLWRSGLDGSTQYYADHWNLLFSRKPSFGYPGRNPALVLEWKWLFIGGLAALAVIGARFIHSAATEGRPRLVLLATGLTCYALSAFVFSQGVVIHPDVWDVLLAWLLIAAVFCFLPADLEVMTKRTGLAMFVSLFVTACYVMVQLRAYAAAVPVAVR